MSMGWEQDFEDEDSIAAHGDPDDYDDGPDLRQMEHEIATGKRCVECSAEFQKAQPEATPNRHKTLCIVCARLFIESRGFNMGPLRDANSEGWAAINRKKKARKS